MTKLSFQLAYRTKEDFPGTIFTVATVLGEEGWSIDRCWFGEAARVIENSIHGTLRISANFNNHALDVNVEERIKHKLQMQVKNALDQIYPYPEENSVFIRRLNTQDPFRFATQIEIADYPGVVRDVLYALYKPGLYAGRNPRKEVVCRLDGLLCVPIYVRGLRGTHGIIDARFRIVNDLEHYATNQDLKNDGVSHERVCERIHEQLRNISGVRQWSILSTAPHCAPLTGYLSVKEQLVPHVDMKAEELHYERKVSGSFPGVAYAAADALHSQNYSIRRIVLTELSGLSEESNILRAGVFWAKPAYYNEKQDGRIWRPGVVKSIDEHVSQYYSGLNHTHVFRESEDFSHRNKIWIACQVEMIDGEGNLAKLLGALVDDKNPTGQMLNIEHLITLFRYGQRRYLENSGPQSVDRIALIEFICCTPSDYPDHAETHSLAVSLNEWLFRRIWHLDEVKSISCKPVRRFGRNAGCLANDIPIDFDETIPQRA